MAGTLVIDTLNASSGVLSTNNGITGIAKAWATFDGTSASPITPSSSFNVSSITYSSGGLYQVNFSTAMPNANYVVAGSGNNSSGNVFLMMNTSFTPTTSAFQFYTATSASFTTSTRVSVVVFSS